MELLQETKSNYSIFSYKQGEIKIGETLFKHSLIISSNEIIPWNAKSIKDVHERDFSFLKPINFDLMIFGTGEEPSTISPYDLKKLIQIERPIELMTTAKAIGTYNFLLSEKRNLIAAFII